MCQELAINHMQCYQTLWDDAMRWKYDGCTGRQHFVFES
jgi:hypothetical protein